MNTASTIPPYTISLDAPEHAAAGETPLNAFTIVGMAISLFALGKACWLGIPGHWMTLLLNNDRRQGDRLVCLLDGFLKRMGDAQALRVQVFE